MDLNICKLLLEHELDTPEQVYLRQPHNGKWQEFTWAEVIRQARQVAQFLQNLGLERGSHISIFSKNCAEWFIADFGITLAGMVNVPLFANQHQNSIDYVLNHAEVKLVFIGKLDNHQRARAAVSDAFPTVNFGYHHKLDTTYNWKDILSLKPLQEIAEPHPDDLYTIIYSSGTSAVPKGAMFTHRSISNYLKMIRGDIFRIAKQPHYRLLSYLPLAHCYERATIQLLSLTVSADVSFAEGLDTFSDNLREVNPSLFSAVPRIWDVFRSKLLQKLPQKKLNVLLKIPVVSYLIKNKIKRQLGMIDCRVPISGAAHLPVSLLNFFDKVGIQIQEGYGQTENLSYATLSMKNERRAGYVGTPRYQVEIKTGDESELLMKSPCLMSGYFKEPEATAAAFTADGWLRTGDVVEIDEKNRVKILGRLSENFKNQKGEFVAPAPIEKIFNCHELVDQLCLVGRELSSNVLLVSLHPEAHKMPKEILKKRLQERLKFTNSQLAAHEKISQILVVKESWTIENDLLTPTLKVKRRMIESYYQFFISLAVTKSQNVVWQ